MWSYQICSYTNWEVLANYAARTHQQVRVPTTLRHLRKQEAIKPLLSNSRETRDGGLGFLLAVAAKIIGNNKSTQCKSPPYNLLGANWQFNFYRIVWAARQTWPKFGSTLSSLAATPCGERRSLCLPRASQPELSFYIHSALRYGELVLI